MNIFIYIYIYEIKKIYQNRLITDIPQTEYSTTIYSIHIGQFYKKIYRADRGTTYFTHTKSKFNEDLYRVFTQ